MNYYKSLEWDKAYRKGKRHFDSFSDIHMYAEKNVWSNQQENIAGSHFWSYCREWVYINIFELN